MKLSRLCVVFSLSSVCVSFNAFTCEETSSGNWLEELVGMELPVTLPDVTNNQSQHGCNSGPKQPDPDTEDPEERAGFIF